MTEGSEFEGTHMSGATYRRRIQHIPDNCSEFTCPPRQNTKNADLDAPPQLTLPFHLARFFANKRNCSHVHFFPKPSSTVQGFANTIKFQKLFDASDQDSMLVPLCLYVDAFPIYRNCNSKSAVGVYAQPLNLDAAFMEDTKSIFSLSATEDGQYTLEELLQPVLSEIHVGTTKGYFIYHAGLDKYIRIKLQLCFVLADMMEQNNLCYVDAPTGYYRCEEEANLQDEVGHKRSMVELLNLITNPPEKDTSEARKGYKLVHPI
jgi:hypothetical protein